MSFVIIEGYAERRVKMDFDHAKAQGLGQASEASGTTLIFKKVGGP